MHVKRDVMWVFSWIILTLSVVFTIGTFLTLSVALAIDETSVGPIYLGNRPESEYPTYLERRVSEWRANASYRLSFQGFMYEIDLQEIDFDSEETIHRIVRNSENLAVFTIDDSGKDAILSGIENQFSTTIFAFFDANTFISDLLSDISHLYQIKTYRLDRYLSANSAQTVIASTVVDGLDPDDAEAIVDAGGVYVIQPGSRFSLLEATSDSNLDNIQLSIIASGMQTVTAETRFHSFLYRSWAEMPSWAEIGNNVRVMRVAGLDFSFFNPMDVTYHLAISSESATSIRLELIGHPFVETVDAVWGLSASIPFSIETIDDASIDASTPGVIVIDTVEETIYRVVVRPGTDGSVWFLNRTVVAPGSAAFTERVAIDERPSISAIYRENTVSKGGD